MTEKQKRFADEYLIDCNATRAYKAVYGCKSDRTANVNGTRLLSKASIQAYIAEYNEKLHTKKIADAQEIMEYLTSVVRGETQSEIVVVEGLGDGCSEAKKVQKAPDEKERLKAAELLGKRYGIFKEKIEVKADKDKEEALENLKAIASELAND